MNLKRLLRNILLLPVLVVFADQKKDPELLEIPGAEGLSVDYFKDLMGYQAPTMNIPLEGTAGMGANELTTQNLLAKFLGTDATQGEAYQLGMGEIKKTLGGEFYDPRTSDFWKGYREVSAMEKEEGVADIRRRGQLGGGLFSTGVAREETGYIAKKGAESEMLLGSLYEKERDRKTGAVGQALGYAGFEEAGKASRIGLGATVGAIPRGIEQQKLTSKYAQALGQEKADYTSSILETATQTGAAEQLMPQWNIDQGGGASPLGFIGTIASALIGK